MRIINDIVCFSIDIEVMAFLRFANETMKNSKIVLEDNIISLVVNNIKTENLGTYSVNFSQYDVGVNLYIVDKGLMLIAEEYLKEQREDL